MPIVDPRALPVVVLLIAGSLAALQAQAPTLTMSQIALLPRGDDPGSLATLRAGIASSDPGVRSVASRRIAVDRLGALIDVVSNALRREADDHVASEMIRALLLVGSPEASAAADDHVERAGPLALRAYAALMGRLAPGALGNHLPRLRLLGTAAGFRWRPEMTASAQDYHAVHAFGYTGRFR
jgi:hypothetical protein